jgi:hypothetical protein
MRLIVGFAIIASALILAGVVWLTTSIITLLRSLEKAEEQISSASPGRGRTVGRKQTPWERSAFAEIAEWNADMSGTEPLLWEQERVVSSRLHWISRALLACGFVVLGGSVLISLAASYSPTLMKQLDPVFDGVVNHSLGLTAVAEVGAIVGLVGGGLIWMESQNVTRR